MSIANIIKSNFRRSFFIAFVGVLVACNVEDINDLVSTTTTTLSGSVGDGPITQAQIVVTDNSGAVLGQAISDTTANYDVNVPADSNYPLLVTASGGTDMVTGGEPDFTLVSVALNSLVRTVNINPFSTLIVKTAQAMSGGLTANNLSLATQYTLEKLNFGLDSVFLPNPITTSINEANVAAIIKASEALGEVIRRTRSALLIAGSNITGDDIIAIIAADMTDGVLDGRGANANAQVAATANIVSAQVLIEILANRLNVGGADATALMDTAIKLSMPSATMTTSDVVITERVLTQARISLAAAQTISSNSNLAAVAAILASLSGNSLAVDIQTELPANSNTVFDEIIAQVAVASNSQLEFVNASVRSGNTGLTPPPTTPPPSTPPTPEPTPTPGAFEFSASAFSVGESDQVVNITIDRVGGSDGVATLEWRTITFDGYGTADFANDYATFLWNERPLTFADGETRKVEQITIHPDSVVEGNETFTVLLRNPTGGASLGSRISSVVTIVDDDTGSTVDTTAPVITLVGANPLTLSVGDTYVEPGATATDDVDGDLTSAIVVDSAVNTTATSSYQVTYNVSDSSGNAANTVIRTVNVVDNNSGDRPWENLLNNVVGFGNQTTGGQGGEVCQVTNLNNSGTGSLRDCATRSGPQWIVFDVSGTINLTSNLSLTSDKTIDGRGQDITITGGDLLLVNVSNVIVHNIKIVNPSVDGIRIYESNTKNIWIDHCTLTEAPDELLSIGRAATDITISWTKFQGYGKAVLISSGPLSFADEVIRVTLHHNHFERTRSRHPLLGFGKAHAFNNLYDHSGEVAVIENADYYSQNNIFDGGKVSGSNVYGGIVVGPLATGTVPPRAVKSEGDWVTGDVTVTLEELNRELVFNPSSYYTFTLETANAALKNRIITGSGWQAVAAPR